MRRLLVIVLGLAMAAASRPAAAQGQAEKVELGVYAGDIHWDLPGVKDGAMVGVRVGYNATDRFGLEAFLDRSRPDLGSFGHAEGTTYGLDALLSLHAGGRTGGPYVLAGAGWGADDYSGIRFWDLGAGWRWRLPGVLAVRADARAFTTDDLGRDGFRRFHYKLSLGLSATLGRGR